MGLSPPKVNHEQHPPSQRRQPSCGRREGLKMIFKNRAPWGKQYDKMANHNEAFPSSPNSIREK